MKRFVLKVFVFTLPVFILFFITENYYLTNQGDLVRIGFLFGDNSYRSSVSKRFEEKPLKCKYVSKINLERKKEFKVLTIGDSFSKQGRLCYKNYLANLDGISVVHFEPFLFLTENPVQTLFDLANGDFFDSIKVDFAVLQSVERYFTFRTDNIDTSIVYNLEAVSEKVQQNNAPIPKKETKPVSHPDPSPLKQYSGVNLFTEKVFKIPFINFLYLFKDKPAGSKTYKVKTETDLFMDKPNSLLFYEEDLAVINNKNDSLKIRTLNQALNCLSDKLSRKGVELIVLPSPDKYDLYYDYIKESDKYPEPLFFYYLNKFPKTYTYLDSKKILFSLTKKTRDVYYYDDTHWSPIATQKIAKELEKVIKSKETQHINK